MLGSLVQPGQKADSHCCPRQNAGFSVLEYLWVSWSGALGITALGTLRGDGWRTGEEGRRGLLVSCILLVSPGPLGRGGGDDTVEFHLVA